MKRLFLAVSGVLALGYLGSIAQAGCFGGGVGQAVVIRQGHGAPLALPGGCFSPGLSAPQLSLDVPVHGQSLGYALSLRSLRAVERQRELERLARFQQAAILRERLLNGRRVLPFLFNPLGGRPFLRFGIGF